MKCFGERLKELRKRRKISQVNLSTKIGICQEAISSYERGITTPSIEVLCKIQKYFNVSADYLLGITDRENSISYNQLNNFEVYLINNYRKLTISEQKLLLKISDNISDYHDINSKI